MNKQFPIRTVGRHLWASYLAFMRNGLAMIGLSALCLSAFVLEHDATAFTPTGGAAQLVPGNEDSGFLTGPFGAPQALPVGAHGFEGVLRSEGLAPGRPSLPDPLATAQGQLAAAHYLAHRYHLSANAVAFLVREAYVTGREIGVDPVLLLAVIGVESSFNPFAESPVGAEGLMQVMSKVHADKLNAYGGPQAALDPVANIKVGALILKDCIRRGGSVRDGLRLYVGSGTEEDGGYGGRVLQEKERIQWAARGGHPVMVPATANAAHVATRTVAVDAKDASMSGDGLPNAEHDAARARDKVAAL